ncbi:Spc19-domain-containing protein [Mycotypha africana]|uniref:Spc19-domain-containing protein n=1 Tax=Mycotypha africana TaxID=64632 RepID=UPI0023001937|nr:Spc19-domain-containing protein [Mycotypha africana]KAI8987528.1 Spc19-domain-containing protein [Mycotypha africana]
MNGITQKCSRFFFLLKSEFYFCFYKLNRSVFLVQYLPDCCIHMDGNNKGQRSNTIISAKRPAGSEQPKVGFTHPLTSTVDLEGCVDHLTNCNRTLKSSVESLRSVTEEFTRQAKFMNVDRSYELVTENDIKTAQREVVRDIGPEIEGLLQEVDVLLHNLSVQEQEIKRKVEDQQRLLKLYKQGNHVLNQAGAAEQSAASRQQQDITAVAEARLTKINQKLKDLQGTYRTEERRYNEQLKRIINWRQN